MRKFSIGLLVAAALAQTMVAPSAHAANRGWFPKKVGECGWVHGRFGVYNGSGIARIWVIGTSHMLNQRDGDPIGPEVLYPAKGGWDPIKHAVYGDFYVCAVERHIKGEMQQVRIQRVRNYVIREWL